MRMLTLGNERLSAAIKIVKIQLKLTLFFPDLNRVQMHGNVGIMFTDNNHRCSRGLRGI